MDVFLLPQSLSRDSTSSSRDSLAHHSQPWFLSPLYRNFPSVLAVCSALGGGIFEMGESVSVAGMCSYSFVYFMYESSPTAAYATHRVSDIVIHPREGLVCTQHFVLIKKKFLEVCFFQVSERKYQSEE